MTPAERAKETLKFLEKAVYPAGTDFARELALSAARTEADLPAPTPAAPQPQGKP